MEKFEVHLIVHEAKKLIAADRGGTSDPYCQIKVEKQLFKTEVVKKSLNPVWNETYDFSARLTTKLLVFEVYDHDIIGGHDFLGGIELDLSTLELDINAQKPTWYDLTSLGREEKVAGSLRLSIAVKRSSVQFEDITKGLALKPLMPDANTLALAKSSGRSCCVMNVVACQDIVAADSDGGSDPFVVVHAGSNTCQTKTLDGLNPIFNEVFTLPLERGVSCLRFNLFDYDVLGSNDFLGCIVVPLSDMAVDKVVDKWEFLCQRQDDDEVSGRIRVIIKLLLPLPPPFFQPVSLAAKPGHGLLQLYVQCATNLVAADSGGTSDPYFQVSIGEFNFKVILAKFSAECAIFMCLANICSLTSFHTTRFLHPLTHVIRVNTNRAH
jgi:Ca2+-dependent lipid-binding protein